MPTQCEHKEHASHNLEFLNTFYYTFDFNDWSITTSFYVAVHIVEYVIAKIGKVTILGIQIPIEHSNELPNQADSLKLRKPGGIEINSKSQHVVRNYLVKAAKEFEEISDHYTTLYKYSKISRYEKYKWEDIKTKLVVMHLLKPILDWVNNNYNTSLEIKDGVEKAETISV